MGWAGTRGVERDERTLLGELVLLVMTNYELFLQFTRARKVWENGLCLRQLHKKRDDDDDNRNNINNNNK